MSLRVLGLCATLVVASVARDASAAGTPVTAATDEQKEAAQKAFSDAIEHAKAGKHEEALAGFRASHDIVASPNSRLMIARELAELKRFGEAYREALIAERLAREAAAVDPKYNDAVTGAAEDLADFRAKVGFVRIDTTGISDSEIVVGGRTVTREELAEPVAVDPGEVEIVARSPRGQESRKVSVVAGAEEKVTFVAEKQPEPEKPKVEPKSMHPFDLGDGELITAGVLGGVGVIGMALFGTLGGLHLAKFSDLEDQCSQNRCDPALEEEADSGRSLQTGANVSLVIGLVGLTAGAAFLIPALVIDERSNTSVRVGAGFASLEATFP